MFAKKINVLVAILSLALISIACQNNNDIVSPETATSDYETLKKLAFEDELLSSFDANYIDEQFSNQLAKVEDDINPIDIRRKVKLVEKDLNVVFEDSVAKGSITKIFEGTMIIAGSYDFSDSAMVDTLIEKPFKTTVTRNIEFTKRTMGMGFNGNNGNGGMHGKGGMNNTRPNREWMISKISLPEGATESSNIEIVKIKITSADGKVVEITNPNEYYFERDRNNMDMIPQFSTEEDAEIEVEVISNTDKADYICLTFGATKHRMDRMVRAKKTLDLVSVTPEGNLFRKVYHQTYTTGNYPGKKHAVVSAISALTLTDDNSAVESNSWGVPYIVQ